jgi:PPOX class probable F420-dependent enzyme
MSMRSCDDGRWVAAACAAILRRMNASRLLDDAARIDGMLRREPIVWLSTVQPDGRPHLVPIWFSWDGSRLFVASKPDARKVRNLRLNPELMLALGEPEDDFDVGLVEAVAELPSARTAELLPPAHLAKYRRQLATLGLDADEYLDTYSQPIVITPTRFLPWHGRSLPASRVDDAPSLLERLRRRLEGALRRPVFQPGPAVGGA